jgi:demethylmenaquinone methyltransferase/2-methoxy-6-polyprenyl-1,4-benzoquinol methylase
MFDGLGERYDLLNDLLSLGLDRWWRRRAVRAVRIRGGDRVLDLGCGSGALGRLLAGRARVVGLDVSLGMLAQATRRSPSLRLVQASAFALPFGDRSFDAAISGFVLRNLHDLPAAFAELHRVVVPGGGVALVDITEPASPGLRRAFDAYLGAVAPTLGALVGKGEEYRYLVRSLAQIPPSATVCSLLQDAGFEQCSARPLTGGTVTLFTAANSGRGAVEGSR